MSLMCRLQMPPTLGGFLLAQCQPLAIVKSCDNHASLTLYQRQWDTGTPARTITPGTPADRTMQTITERSSKADIITAAVELTDQQQGQIETLQQRQTILLALLGALAILQLL
jgi:hypothetical protein